MILITFDRNKDFPTFSLGLTQDGTNPSSPFKNTRSKAKQLLEIGGVFEEEAGGIGLRMMSSFKALRGLEPTQPIIVILNI